MSLVATKDIECRIVGTHPHRGKEGVIRCVNGKVKQVNPYYGDAMYLIEFEGQDVSGCYAEKKNLQIKIGGRWKSHDGS